MRNSIILGTLLAVLSVAAVAQASDRLQSSDRNELQVAREGSDDGRSKRPDGNEQADRSRERHEESRERDESREGHDESHERKDRR